ncbi:MAG: bile acid:sodium symporter family protein, partial [Leptospiraceae bacterium]|nr:bile acid:sodium symporter family protein [Leptospiraceae bacterium]
TYLLTMWIKPMPSIALGMMLVAACPGGNVSNFITHLAKGNTALSITMTAISTSVAIIMTPFNIWFWSSLNPSVAPIYKKVQLDPGEMFLTIFILLGIPLVLGLLTQKFLPNLASKMAKYFKFFSIIIFAFFVIAALYANFDYFIKYIGIVAVVVMIHNATAIGLGYVSGKLMRLNFKDTRAIAIEVGIQNSALALILIFNFFNGLGGMALIAAWWGVWHLIVGLSLATIWSRYDNKKE